MAKDILTNQSSLASRFYFWKIQRKLSSVGEWLAPQLEHLFHQGWYFLRTIPMKLHKKTWDRILSNGGKIVLQCLPNLPWNNRWLQQWADLWNVREFRQYFSPRSIVRCCTFCCLATWQRLIFRQGMLKKSVKSTLSGKILKQRTKTLLSSTKIISEYSLLFRYRKTCHLWKVPWRSPEWTSLSLT